MNLLHKIAAAVLIALLAAAGYGLWTTNQSTTPRVLQARAAVSDMPAIDQNTYITAKRLSRLATTAEEQALAQAAVQTADHELDLAFTAAMHNLKAHPPVFRVNVARVRHEA